MWVRLLKPKALDYRGKMRQYQPGDWYEVGKHEAQMWIAHGEAEVPGVNELKAFVGGDDMGILVVGSEQAAALGLSDLSEKVSVQIADGPVLQWSRTLIWSPTVVLKQELVPTGFNLLNTWDVAMPLWNYDELALRAGDEEGRARTLAVIRDLRVPMLDTRLIFVKRNERTTALFAAWAAERRTGDDERLTFLRAHYQTKCRLLPLPITWVGKQVNEG